MGSSFGCRVAVSTKLEGDDMKPGTKVRFIEQYRSSSDECFDILECDCTSCQRGETALINKPSDFEEGLNESHVCKQFLELICPS
jgi:hypothetical protein